MYLYGWTCPVLLLPLPGEGHTFRNPLVPEEWEMQGIDLNQIHAQELMKAIDQINSNQIIGTRVRNEFDLCATYFRVIYYIALLCLGLTNKTKKKHK